jgi:alpha-glucoside transport system substrate-binding protein
VTYRPAKKFTATIAGVSALALVLTACSSSSTTSETTAATSAAASSAPSSEAATGSAEPAAPVGATSDWCEQVTEQFGDLTGTTVGVYTVIVGQEAENYEKAWQGFTECTGATVTQESTREFEAQVLVRVQSGNPPDVGIFPQPGLLSQLVNDTGAVKPLSEPLEAFANQYFPEDWMNYGRVNDIPFGIPNNADFKSLVWYSPKTFTDKGLTVPTTWEELTSLYEGIAGEGTQPWCIGIGSGEATGWQITDWLEEYVLRLWGPEVYDQWVTNEVKFTDPMIADALAQVGAILKDPKYVNAGFGDVATIASTPFDAPAAQIINGNCTLTRQAANFDNLFATIGPDGEGDAFYFPPITEDFGQTVLGGGTFYAAFADRPEVQAFMWYMASPEFANARAQAGSYISANRGLQMESVESPVQQTALETLLAPDTVFRFDASDLMPATVGSGSFWRGMVDWIDGKPTSQVLEDIQAGYEN